MPAWRLRDFHEDDLDEVISVWDQSRRPDEPHPVFTVSEAVAAARSGQPAVVAVVGEQVVGMAVAHQQGERAWITMIALSDRWRNRGIGSALLTELENRLRRIGVRRISALLPAHATGSAALRNSGYQERGELSYFEKIDHVGVSDAGLLEALGGQMIPRELWQSMAGMEAEKRIIERRIVLPLSQPDLADRYGVSPPKAVILFGPPGTGKTSFAKAVAGRLGWPFVELFPSRLAAPGVSMAAALREAFNNVMELESVVVFIDEVEEIAGSRSPIPTDPARGVTNELLKLIPAFRQHDDRLLIVATNSVRSLDSAFLRHGRFDYIIPVGPPDEVARAAIWRRYLGPNADAVEVDKLVEASEMFTPADIEFAARKGAQAAFEREIEYGRGEPARTDDYLEAIADTRPTLTLEMIAEFEEDISACTRL
ncbi:AAA domain family protein [Mycolicibacterium hassiacum DSM 44199]|jgi:ribosomal protein S18 acetylase RimI-like enzyme|uniref:AAA domain family protein n=1 Tax=Mycolicibacterium hassiacum (strain DSM 44199 / CIP 105218 / JCM 12690 / 3849) TaxID=1122247 RepID=K5B8G7_MYCHD|nr:GNAT family N-acetyltransferase [Mycolicibacterium hassiacum]EKF23668.1 AAA domain family protein [Mycolicibacterium hassiacum DSM 44199]MBX5486274.1 GNAT family N-acetyltransferase [Mycolicibacterium hassiacum]MDA4088598.1 ATPase AAA [Mycolicibacterium hassiacum DSM 44199]PZN21261.1 MAG: GNAT family N-acetyltransferase [Mycolicibacterium hassiacum]VCT90139.1 ATP-dependent zinc metalloprotease FtsH 2 [Mycolicibacterium hassiacum DSM 44199]